MRLRALFAAIFLALASCVTLAWPTTVHAAAVPGTSCTAFPAGNIWNTDISNLPVNANSATWIANTGGSTGRLTHPDFGGPPYGIPFNVVSNSHATIFPSFDYASESDAGPYPWGNDLAIEGPTDSHMLTINKDTCTLYETFATDIPNHHAGSGAIFPLGSNALRPAGWTSADAAGLPIFPGLVRLDEVQVGLINHAIRFTVHNTDDTYLWPARHHAGINDPSLPPMGARFRLKMSYDISSYSLAAQVVLTAFKHYGLIVADNGSDWYFQGTEDAGWNNSPYDTMISDLKKIPVNAFEAVDESALMVDPNSALAGTAPAAPVAPTAAPIDASAAVIWTPPATGGQPITSYTITGTPSGSAVASGSATSAVVYGLTNGVSYTFTVKASNAVGTGPPSPSSNPVTPLARIVAQGPPATPTSRAPVNPLPPPPPTPQPRLPMPAHEPAALAASTAPMPREFFLRL
jgi:hypothetical protein